MINRQTVLFALDDSDDKNLISSMCDKAEKSIFSGRTIYTKFLTPREVNMAVDRLGEYVKVTPYSGWNDGERCVVAFSDFSQNEECDFLGYPIDAIKIKTKNKTVYSHRDYLGSLMNIGISRDLLGDIVICENEAVLFCLNEITDYIIYNLTKVSNTGVILERCDISELSVPNRAYNDISKTVSSKRLDCIISAVINKSRSISADYITKGVVCVNYEPIKNTSYTVCNDDIISVRGYGKAKINFGDTLSKKGKVRLSIKQYV